MKTCLRELTQFVSIGDAVHKEYDNAVRVKLDRVSDQLRVMKRKKKGEYRRNSAKLKNTNKKPGDHTMVFLKDSPKYCNTDSERDFPGTGGRTCSIDSYGSYSCDELCCGRGYQERRVVTRNRCKCKFHWCCEIRCKECSKTETKYFCNY